MTGKIPLVVVIGPTSVGKTGWAIELAQTIHGEIVSADSRQVYRFMDIGTAKPTAEEQKRARHHLIDVVNPDDNLSLAQYQRLAVDAIHDIHARGKIPLLVGGTGQYVSAVVEGWSIPEVPPNPALRAELEAFAIEHGALALHERLAHVDAAAAAKIDYQNVRRVVRALEVYMETGQPISLLQQKTPPPYRLRQFGLTMERERLYERADRRVDLMMAAGFVDEVRHLIASGYARHLPSMSGLGYAQLAAHLLDGLPMETAIESTKKATHDFIRRQYTWFRKYQADVTWIEVDNSSPRVMIELAQQWLSERTT